MSMSVKAHPEHMHERLPSEIGVSRLPIGVVNRLGIVGEWARSPPLC